MTPSRLELDIQADVSAREWDLPDPALTEDGIAQCKALAADLKGKYSFPTERTLILVSPMKRTLQSFQYGLGWLRDQGVRVELRAEWQVSRSKSRESLCSKIELGHQESTGNPCDIGTEPLIMAKEWPDLDFTQLDPVYPGKTGLYDPSEEGLQRRAFVVREWLHRREEEWGQDSWEWKPDRWEGRKIGPEYVPV